MTKKRYSLYSPHVFHVQLIIPAIMGLYMDRNRAKTKLIKAFMTVHLFTIVLGSFITVAGTYTTIQSIIDAYHAGAVSRAFSCS